MKSSQIVKVISLFLSWLFLNSCATSNTLIQTPPPDIPSKVVSTSIIQNISFIEEENYTRIKIEGSETLEPPFYKLLSDPLRIAIDVPNIDLKQIKEPLKVDNGTVAGVLTTQYDDKGRFEIGLAQMTNYNILKEDKNLIIDIEKVKKISEVKEEVKKEETIKEKETEITPPELKKEEIPPVQPVRAVAAPETLKKAKKILNILFDQKKEFIVFNIVADGKIGNYNTFKLDSPPRLVLDILEVDTQYPKKSIKIQNPFIKQVRIGHHPDKVRFVFECPTSQIPFYQTKQIDDKLIVSFGNVPQPPEPQIILQENVAERILPPQKVPFETSKEGKTLSIGIEKPKKIEAIPETKKEEAKEEVKKEETIKEKETEITPPELKKEEIPPVQPVRAAAASETLKKAKNILNILFDQKKEFIVFNIVADGKIGNYNTFKLDSPPGLVLDILEVDTQYPKKSIKIQNPFIKQVRIGHHPDKVRFVFECPTSQIPFYQTKQIDDKLIVSFGNVPQPPESQIILQEKVAERISPKKTQVKAPIDFKQMDNKSRIVVSLTEEPIFESRTVSKNTIAVDIKNAFLPKHLQRRVDTSEFDSAVKYIDLKNMKTRKTNDVRILIKLKEEAPFKTSKEGKTLLIDIEKPTKIEAKIEAVPETKKEEGVVETKKEEVKKEEVKKEEVKKEEVKKEEVKKEEVKKFAEEGPTEKVYTGRRMSLDFKDADIKNILRLIAEISNFNIILGDDVTGKITMRLVDVPWDQALDIILQAKSLGMTKVGNVIRIAPLDSLKKEIQAELESRRTKEKLEDLVTDLIPVNYATAKDIGSQVKGILSDRGDVKVDDRTNILIVKDIPRNIVAAKNLVKSLDTKTPQVMIEARIVEANLTFQRDLGISWGFMATTRTDLNKVTTVGGGTAGTSTLRGTDVTTRKLVDLPATGSILEFLFTSDFGLKNLDIAISASESNGDAKVISSPKIATLDNKEASIEQGLRIPYRKLTTEGTITTDFIDANLKLTVTPHVTNDGNIKMSIKAKKDAPDRSIEVDGVPSIDKKEAITEVMIKDGGIVVIAGVYTNEKSDATDGVPFFSKIPVLGWLFKKETKKDTRKDLLIFISPKILKDQV